MECIIHSRKSFPDNSGINNRLGSNTIILGKQSPDFNMKIIFFGCFAMVYTGTTNTFKRRSIPIISLRGYNEDRGQLFVSLYTRKDIHGYDWVELPIDNEVVKRV